MVGYGHCGEKEDTEGGPIPRTVGAAARPQVRTTLICRNNPLRGGAQVAKVRLVTSRHKSSAALSSVAKTGPNQLRLSSVWPREMPL